MSKGGDGKVIAVLRRLSAQGARLSPRGDGRYFVERQAKTRRSAGADPDERTVRVLRARGLVEPDGTGGLVASASGRALVRRSLAGADGFAEQHQDRGSVRLNDPDFGPINVAVNRGESPLSWLTRRKGRDGRPLINAAEFAAGERLRSDYERARIMPRVTANWTAAVASARRSGTAGAGVELTDAVLAARRRVEKALASVGPEFSGLLIDFCCFLKGLEEIERERQWPARSAKIVIRLGLIRLARHYGLAAKASGQNRSGIVRHWGTDDYRPVID